MIFDLKKIWQLLAGTSLQDDNEIPVSEGTADGQTKKYSIAQLKAFIWTYVQTQITGITKGDTGASGATGPQGVAGSAGPQGAKGDKGDTGLKGNVGPQGSIGIQGPFGAQGPTGANGPIGIQGAQGPIGIPGLDGADYTSLLISKAGSNVDANGDLDLSAETIPDFPSNPAVYIDGIVGGYQTQYNNSTKIITGLYGVDSVSVINIKF